MFIKRTIWSIIALIGNIIITMLTAIAAMMLIPILICLTIGG